MKKSKFRIIGIALLLILAGAILLLAFPSGESPAAEDTLQAEIKGLAGAELLEWQAALLNPAGLGLAYLHPEAAARQALKLLKKTEMQNPFAWWLLSNTAMPEQRELLESAALKASASENPDQRYHAISILQRIGSPAATEKLKAQIEAMPLHLKIALIRQQAIFLTEESVPVTQQLLGTQAQILAPEIQAELKDRLNDFMAISSAVRESAPDESLRPAIMLHISAILAAVEPPPGSHGRGELIKAQLGALETRELFRRIAESLKDAGKARKLEAVL